MRANLLRSCTVSICRRDGPQISCTVAENRRVVLTLPLPEDARIVTLSELVSWGGEQVNFFSVDAVV